MGICQDLMCYCLHGLAALCLAKLSGFTHQIQDTLNLLWYHLAISTLNRFDRWPNYTTGRLVTPSRYITNHQLDCDEHDSVIEVMEAPRSSPVETQV